MSFLRTSYTEWHCIESSQSSHIEHGVCIPVFDQRGELPLLPFENPIGFVPASRGEFYIESMSFGKND